LDQNVKFKDKDKELTKKWNFPPEFDYPLNMKKVSIGNSLSDSKV
jgi:hypothetical protein